MVSFPYHSHIFRDSYGSGMGIVWEASHKQVPLLGVPGITLDSVWTSGAVLEEEKSWNSSLPSSTMRMRARSRHSCRCKCWQQLCLTACWQPVTISASLLVDISSEKYGNHHPKYTHKSRTNFKYLMKLK